jgi:hypothetical protein
MTVRTKLEALAAIILLAAAAFIALSRLDAHALSPAGDVPRSTDQDAVPRHAIECCMYCELAVPDRVRRNPSSMGQT